MPSCEDLCPICTEDLSPEDKLDCGHLAHVKCVQEAADVFQEQLAELGYPARKFAQCPICRADLGIKVKPLPWNGKVVLQNEQLLALVHILETQGGIITADAIPSFITEQMPGVNPEELQAFTIKVATILWLTKHVEIPLIMTIRKSRSGRQGRFGCRILV